MKGLNLSKLKKVKCEKDFTTFKHPDGHEVKVAHAKLSPKMKDELDKIPEVKKMAGGGMAMTDDTGGGGSKDDDNNPDPIPRQAAQAPVSININSGPSQVQPQALPAPDPGSPQATGVAGQAQPTPQAAPQPQMNMAKSPAKGIINQLIPSAEASPNDADVQPQAQQTNIRKTPDVVVTPGPDDTAQPQDDSIGQEAQKASLDPMSARAYFQREDQAFMNDLSNGHIKPETYGSLYGKKDTLGKVGTIFALLAGGAGGGLTKTGNPALEMMDKEIERDLDAQKTNRTNAQNFYKLNMEHQMQEAQQKYLGQQGAKVEAETGAVKTGEEKTRAEIPGIEAGGLKTLAEIQNVPLQGKLLSAQAQLDRANADTIAYNKAATQTYRSTLHHLIQMTQKMPEGPNKEAYKQALAQAAPAINDKVANFNDAAVANIERNKLLFGATPGAGQEQQIQKNIRGMQMMGPEGEKRAEELRSTHFPGIEGQTTGPMDKDTKTKIMKGIDYDRKLHEFMKWTADHSGDLSPADKNYGQALSSNLSNAYREANNGGVFKAGEQGFINGVIDEDPTKFFNDIRVTPKLLAASKDHRNSMDTFFKSLGYKGYPGYQAIVNKLPAGAPGIADGTKGTWNGKAVTRKNGKWVQD